MVSKREGGGKERPSDVELAKDSQVKSQVEAMVY